MNHQLIIFGNTKKNWVFSSLKTKNLEQTTHISILDTHTFLDFLNVTSIIKRSLTEVCNDKSCGNHFSMHWPFPFSLWRSFLKYAYFWKALHLSQVFFLHILWKCEHFVYRLKIVNRMSGSFARREGQQMWNKEPDDNGHWKINFRHGDGYHFRGKLDPNF